MIAPGPDFHAPRRLPRRKRAFDLVVTVVSAPIWIPVLVLGSLAVLATSGRPVFYVSPRRVGVGRTCRIVKFRAMKKDAERLANRDTVPILDTRFLNIPLDSPLYTGAGRMLERCSLTELPQLVHVMDGTMSLVGNRPLPENVVAALKSAHFRAEDRFLTPAGLCGPVQLAGRDRLSDAERLAIESAYCRRCLSDYSVLLDLKILVFTVLRCLRLYRGLEAGEVLAFVGGRVAPAPASELRGVPARPHVERTTLPAQEAAEG